MNILTLFLGIYITKPWFNSGINRKKNWLFRSTRTLVENPLCCQLCCIHFKIMDMLFKIAHFLFLEDQFLHNYTLSHEEYYICDILTMQQISKLMWSNWPCVFLNWMHFSDSYFSFILEFHFSTYRLPRASEVYDFPISVFTRSTGTLSIQ